jgi:hypothetical protein
MTTTLERIMAVYNGHEGFRVVFQPRIKHWHDVNQAAGTLPDKYQGMYLDEIYENLGVTPREAWLPGEQYLSLIVEEGEGVEVWIRQEKDTILTEYRTPIGTIRQIEKFTEHGMSRYQSEHFLKSLDDFKVYKFILEKRSYRWNQRRYDWETKRFANILPLKVDLPRMPLMWLMVEIMGFQQTVKMLWRHPKETEELMQLLENEFYKMLEACRGHHIVELNFGDNMHQDMCSPPLFKKYVVPFYQRIMPKIHDMGMYATSHWDGFVKQLLPLAKDTGLDGLECVTPLPQGDVTIEEMQESMKGMFLRDGIPAILFCPWMDIEKLQNQVKTLLQSFYPRIILGLSDLLPANADIERIRLVNKIVEEFNKCLK